MQTENGISQMMIFPEALIQYKNQSIAVNLLQSRMEAQQEDEGAKNAIQNLEYSFSSAIKKVAGGGKPLIGFTEGHKELTDIQLKSAIQRIVRRLCRGPHRPG